MTQLEYEQKKRECWEEYWRTHKTYLHGDSAEIVLHETFTDAFDRAYTLGKQTETISQEEIEKAALDYIRTNPFVNFRTATTARESFVDGANFTLGKQEKDAKPNNTIKARRKSDGEIIEVREWRGASDVIYSTPDMNRFYQASDLDFDLDADTVIQGWACRDNNSLNAHVLIGDKPKRNGFNFWENKSADYITLPSDLFPDLTWDDDPIEVELTIKRKNNG